MQLKHLLQYSVLAAALATGAALAAAREAGAQVTLVAGPVHLPTPRGVRRIDVQSAQNMLEAVDGQAQAAHVLIATAAVADWRPAQAAHEKIKKDGSGQTPLLAFVENPDILATVARSPRAQSGELFCVGFAAESHDLVNHARAKRERKGVDLLVVNLADAENGFESADNAVEVIGDGGSVVASAAGSKRSVSSAIWDAVIKLSQ